MKTWTGKIFTIMTLKFKYSEWLTRAIALVVPGRVKMAAMGKSTGIRIVNMNKQS